MAERRKVLSSDHARALIKEAIGIIEGDRAIQAEAAAEIAAIEAAHASSNPEPKPERSPRS
ncbi:hypothetical protein MKK65_23755 [Methylobacterium sp. J-001]|uniref:hypothetical protein n=1 Tax=Methylobacterium sp. J-001 TaxID=2836609 RepID=UPI001FB90B44|nr:hypothetical protein [Methylobacterium sp. J-001]MCJ2119544.1 hypothetical protein [Methylobacterium sp. J-001]